MENFANELQIFSKPTKPMYSPLYIKAKHIGEPFVSSKLIHTRQIQSLEKS